jgi:N utilization substance protein B
MISRRNIRVKVMQTIYTVNTLEGNTTDPQKLLEQHFHQTRALLVYLIYFLSEMARYAEKDAHQRASKHLPSADDLNVNTKIAGNEVLLKIYEDTSLQEQFKN